MTRIEKDQRAAIVMADAGNVEPNDPPEIIQLAAMVCTARTTLLLVDVVFDGLEEIKAAIEGANDEHQG